MLPVEDLQEGIFRLLEVDNRLSVPSFTNIRTLILSRDVIHSWTLPALGIKIDALPGRLNQIRINLLNYGVFYGQCSEICGQQHRFIPICLERISRKDFLNYVKN